MRKTFCQKKSAFSLIELSIVLIIIGLLIAGVTGGASLIKSSELRAVMNEARGFQTAVNAFYTQFDALPGDYATAIGSNTAAGDADGYIEFHNGTRSESANAWNMLKNTGGIDGISTAALTADVTFKSDGTGSAPASKIKGAGWIFSHDTNSSASPGDNVVILTGGSITAASSATDIDSSSSTSALVKIALVPADALSIDSKLDDGVANTGKIKAVNPTSSTCSSAGTYTTTTTTKQCALSFKIDVNS